MCLTTVFLLLKQEDLIHDKANHLGNIAVSKFELL